MAVTLVQLRHAASVSRVEARARIRAALVQDIGIALGLAPQRLAIGSTPGLAPWLLIDGARASGGVSFSHDGVLSLGAFDPDGAVGVDVMQLQAVDDWAVLARDYLGPAVLDELAQAREGTRTGAFAQAWVAHEAQLKRLGQPLSEWRAPLPACEVEFIDVGPGFVAALAHCSR